MSGAHGSGRRDLRKMRILFLSDNFPPESNAAATRVYERAVYWARWGHRVTVLTTAPNFPEGKLFAGYENHWYRRESRDDIEIVRVKSFIAKNEGVARRTLDFLTSMVAAYAPGLIAKRPDIVIATSPQFFTAVGGWAPAATRRLPFILEISGLLPPSIVPVG